MRRYIIILVSALSLLGCEEFAPVFTGTYGEPSYEKIYAEEDFAGMELKTIAQVKAMYVDGPVTFDEDFYIKGQVTTSDRTGNFYREFYIQDATSGIAIKVGKSGLYNTYKMGQWVYVKCKGLTLGDYEGAKQIGYEDVTGEYETAYIDVQMLIDRHVFKGKMDVPVEPVDLTDHKKTPVFDQEGNVKEEYVGKLVKIDALTYANGIFCLMYVDPNLNHKLQSNRIFLDEWFSDPRYPGGPPSGKVGTKLMDGTKLKKNWSVDTWAMSKNMNEWYIENGNFDYANIGNDDSAILYIEENKEMVKPSAYSVSQYFSMSDYSDKYIAIRSSGYAKFADTRIPEDILAGKKKLTVTAVLGVYEGDPQLTLIDLGGLTYPDGTPLYPED